MKSQRLEQLSATNKHLAKSSWSNYQQFLAILLSSTDHPSARELEAALAAKDFTKLVLIADTISSTVYSTAAEHRLCVQLAAVIRKYPFPDGSTSFDPKGKALETFMKAERKCRRVNQRFRLFRTLRSPHEQALVSARKWISHVLGPLRLSDVWDNCAFGAGASIGVGGNATNLARKLLAKRWSVTTSAFDYARAALKTNDHIFELLTKGGREIFCVDPDEFNSSFGKKANVIDYNNIAFVPKTAKTLRTIAVEPMLNGYLQKGVDELMRKRLKRVGINLEDQSPNQRLSREGSIPGQADPYATIDLSSASDSVSIELCRFLLPEDWFVFMNQIRSPRFVLEGRNYPFNKFATMGNGFCFPLETLIFASLCHVAYREGHLREDFSVYGDDIIVRTSVAPRVLDLLRICGFTANTEKTFLSGPFRESCGTDWFEGKDVRPVNLDYAFDSVENVFKFCNLCRSKDTWEDVFSQANEFLISLIPPNLKFTRPYKGNVDTALEVPYDVFMTSKFAAWNAEKQSWSWLEIVKSASQDYPVTQMQGYNVALTCGALAGAMSSLPFAERYKSRTNIRRVCYAGGNSTWMPGALWKGGSEYSYNVKRSTNAWQKYELALLVRQLVAFGIGAGYLEATPGNESPAL